MPGLVTFGDHALEPGTRTLWHGRERVELQQQPMELLLLLVEYADTVVTRDMMRERVWPDVVVDYDQNINYAIRQIRVALSDDAGRIQTVPRRGYRFVGPLEPSSRDVGRSIGLAAAVASVLVIVFGAGLVAAHTETGAFIYEHIAHPDHCPYVRMVIPSLRNS
jgi:DNA-binding winged helix-turn-helix (wHTH) protein